MKTRIIKLYPKKIEIPSIQIAARILKRGGLVAFPTETVYGLGANALDAKAVKKIFDVKGRPTDNPLIVHISDKKDVYFLAEKVPKKAEKLMQTFWPGPLTLVLKRSNIVPNITTANLDSVAIRMSSNKIALALIKEAKIPLAAPSANLSGKPSPTLAEHVLRDLRGKINLIIDGGETKIGIESTVLDLTSDPPLLLRPGGITLEDLQKVLGTIRTNPSRRRNKTHNAIATSPGMKYRHYSPNACVIVVEGEYTKIKKKVQELVATYTKEGNVVGVMTVDKYHHYKAHKVQFVGKKPTTFAKNLFKIFREFDDKKIDIIIVEGIKEKELGVAIMNRLRKSAQTIINV